MTDDKKKLAITFRGASPADAQEAVQLIYSTFPQMATFIIGLGNEDRAKKILTKIFIQEGHRFSYKFAEVALVNGRLVGLAITFPGKILSKLDRRLATLIYHQYRLRGKIALIVRGWPLLFVNEALRDEFILSNLAMKKRYQGKGYGTKFLAHIEERARTAGFKKLVLRVHIQNPNARRLYEREGYHVKSVHLESNKRVAYLGAGYYRMIKDLS